MSDSFSSLFELSRLVVKVGLTEEGLFWENEVPASLAISYLELEYPIRITMSDEGGKQFYMKFAAPKAMNKDKKYGCTISYNGTEIAKVTGEVNVTVTAEMIATSSEFDSDTVSRAKEIYNQNVDPTLKI